MSLFWLHNHKQRHISVTQQGSQQENFSKKHAVIIRLPIRTMLGTVNEDLFWNWLNCVAWLNISSEGNEIPQLLSKKQTYEVSKITGWLRNCYSWHAYVHNWAKWPECESDHKPLPNLEIMSGSIVLSLYMCIEHLNGCSAPDMVRS